MFITLSGQRSYCCFSSEGFRIERRAVITSREWFLMGNILVCKIKHLTCQLIYSAAANVTAHCRSVQNRDFQSLFVHFIIVKEMKNIFNQFKVFKFASNHATNILFILHSLILYLRLFLNQVPPSFSRFFNRE